jgi:hypothetical protein
MNTANLQLQGLCVAIASLLQALRTKGLLSATEIDQMLEEAEEAAGRFGENLRPSNGEAVAFPIRFLKAVNSEPGPGISNFHQIARQVGLQIDRDREGGSQDEDLAIARATLQERDA